MPKPLDDVREISKLAYGFIASRALFAAIELREAIAAALDAAAPAASTRGALEGELSVWDDESALAAMNGSREHVAALRRKLGDPRWIENRRGVGFRLSAPPDDQV